MKKLFLIIFLVFSCMSTYSQAPEKFTYQSVVRSLDGNLLTSTAIGIKISILKNSDEGTAVYTETHSVKTNPNGLVTLIIGNGVSGDNISDIDWSSGSYYLKVEVDPNGGIGYTIEQTAQLLSVPYALFAGNSSGTDLDKDVTGILPVSKGGTGSSTSPMIAVVTAPNASVARGILGIGEVGGSKVVLKDVTDNYLTLKETNNNSGDQELTAGIVPITLGGTGSTTAPMVGVITAANAAAARAILEIDAAGTDNSTAVTLKEVTDNYLTLDSQEITSGTVPLTLGGTGATDAATARTNLGLGTIATQASDAVVISGGTIDGTKIGETTQTTGAFTSVNANTVSAGIFQSSGDTDVTLKTGNETTGNITIANGADGDINISPVGDGKVRIDNLLFPSADGTAGQVLKTDGSGKLVWESVDPAGTDNSTAVTLKEVTGNYLTLDGQEITSGTVPITLGGTGSSTAPMVGVITAADAAAARTVLGVDASGTDSSTAVTLATVADNYLTLDGQEITSGTVPITLGGTGSTTAPMVGVITAADAAAARTVLGVDASGTDSSTAVTLATVADNYLTLDGQEITSGTVPITLGGTGSTTAPMVGVITAANAAAARDSLSLGTIATQASDAVSITGGAIDGTKIGETTQTTGAFTSVNANTVSAGIFQSSGDTDVTLKTGNATTGNITIANGADGDINISPVGDGKVRIDNLLFPSADGTAGQILETDGSGNLVWAADDSGSVTSIDDLSDAKTGGTNFTGSILIGHESVANLTADAQYNIGIGQETLQSLTDGDYNIAIGVSALKANQSGEGNTAIGIEALKSNTTGNYNTALGLEALELNTGDYNTAVGSEALESNTTGSYNTGVGEEVLESNTEGQYNTSVGYKSLATITTQNYNTAVGYKALEDNVENSQTAVGYKALSKQTTGDWNSGFGMEALYHNKTGSANTALGYQSLFGATDNSHEYNTAIGYFTGKDITTGSYNTILGAETMSSNTTGSYNVAVGFRSLLLNLTGGYNTALGYYSMYNSLVDANTALGYSSMYGNTSGVNNTGVGYWSLWANQTGSNNTAVGKFALQGVTDNSFSNNTAVGYNAGKAITTGTQNIAMGVAALTAITTGSDNTALGFNSLKSVTTQQDNVAVGANALDVNTASYNVAVGSGAGGTNTNGGGSVFLGYNANGAGSGGSKVVAIGMSSAYENAADEIIAIGDETMYTNSSGTKNIGIGKRAIMYNATGDGNTAVGWQSLIGSSGNNHSNNSAFGNQAGSAIETGSDNVFVGKESGDTTTTGSNNVVLGSTADVSAAAASNQIVIGYGATGVANNSVTLGNTSNESVFISSTVSTKPLVELKNTTNDAVSGILKFTKDKGAAGAAGDDAGAVQFFADNQAEEQTMFAELKAEVSDYHDGTEGGKFTISVAEHDGTSTAGLVVQDGSADGEIDVTIGAGTASVTAVAGTLSVGGAFTIPASIGSSGQVLKVPSSGTTLEWGSSGGGALADLSDVTNPVFSSFYIGQKTSDYTITDTSSHQNIGIGSFVMRYISGSYDNVAIGYDALMGTSGQFSGADRNVAIGSNSMRKISSGDDNVAVGYAALKANTLGINNVAIGTNALLNNVGANDGTGDDNVAVGYETLKANTTGFDNVAVGYQSLAANVDGGDNVSIGKESLINSTSGDRNTAVGSRSMYLNSTGEKNVAFGYSSGKSGDQNASFGNYSLASVTGNNNTALGFQAGNIVGGNTLTSGTNNVIIGHTATVEEGDATNRIVIGKGALGLDDNTVTIGNSSITAWLSGSADNVDLGTSSNQFDVVYANKLGFGSQAMTLPTADGSANQILSTDGSGTISWDGSLQDQIDAIRGNANTLRYGDATHGQLFQTSGGTGRDTGTYGSGSDLQGQSFTTGSKGGILQRIETHSFGGVGAGSQLNNGLAASYIKIREWVNDNETVDNHALTGAVLATSAAPVFIDYTPSYNPSGDYYPNVKFVFDETLSLAPNTKYVMELHAGSGIGLYNKTSNQYNGGQAYDIYGINLSANRDHPFMIYYSGSLSSTVDELNLLDGSVANTVVNNKAVIYGGSGEIAATTLTASGAVTANNYVTTSDARLKEDIKPLRQGIEFIKLLNPVTYNKMTVEDYLNKSEEIPKKTRSEIGLIAQEVKKVADSLGLKNIVVKGKDGIYRMDYEKIIMPLLKSVQEQQEIIKELNNRLELIEKLLLKK